jgi:hypothetical protein
VGWGVEVEVMGKTPPWEGGVDVVDGLVIQRFGVRVEAL